MISNSDSCEVYKNLLAWNANGISVLERNRTNGGVTLYVFTIHIHDNGVVMQDNHQYAPAWLSGHSTRMFNPT